MGVMSDVIQAAIDNKEYEVTFSVIVHAKNVGNAIKRAALVLEYGAARVKDVKEI
jgi:hypothetical protein